MSLYTTKRVRQMLRRAWENGSGGPQGIEARDEVVQLLLDESTGLDGLSRDHFEDRAYAHFFVSTIEKVDNSPFPFVTTDVYKSEFCERVGDRYKRDDVQLMWIGYQLAMGVLP